MRWFALAAALTVAAVAAIRRRWMVVAVVGTSMAPALQPGDVVLARRCDPAGLSVGDVVVLAPPDGTDRPPGRRPRGERTWLVKRVAAVPGAPLPFDPTGTVPPRTVAVLGDNGGHDSRTFGPLPFDRVLGVVVRQLTTAPVAPGPAEQLH